MIVMQVSASGAQGLDVHRGVNETHLTWKTSDERENIIEDMRQAGVGSVRVSLSPPYDKSIDSIDLLARKNLSVLLVVEIVWPQLAAQNATRRPGRGPIWSVVPLSQLDPAFFREQFGALWREIEKRHVQLDAIELGNEINWAALVVVKQLRDESAYNRGAKIIPAGLTAMPATFAANVGAEYVDTNETLDILKADGLDALVDGYGVHIYPNPNQTQTERAREFETVLRSCAAGGHGHPCWLTEWGVRQPNLACPSDESKRVPLIRETLERIAANVRQKRIGGSYYYDWDDQPIEYAVWRCGGLTEDGKVLFGR